MTFPTKVPSDSLGWIGSLKRTSDKSPFPMALGSCGHRITHQLRPINMNGRSILAVTSIMHVFPGGIWGRNALKALGVLGVGTRGNPPGGVGGGVWGAVRQPLRIRGHRD